MRIISPLYHDNSENKYNLTRDVEIIAIGNSKTKWQMQRKTVGKFK